MRTKSGGKTDSKPEKWGLLAESDGAARYGMGNLLT
jgi:hypothetical protein